MAYWLLKSEPGSWSWDDQVRVGVEGWNGVRNHQAAANLKAMRKGERAFFYHSRVPDAEGGPQVVGIVEVEREAYPDASDPTGRFVMVDVRTREPLARPVPLKAMRAEPSLADFKLLRQSRLSVVPVSSEEWKIIRRMGGLKG